MTPRTLLLGAALIVAGALAYLTSFGGVFLFDDVRYIVEDARIRTLGDFWGSRPVVTLSLAINYALGGLDPFGYHLFNLTIHLLAGLTLFGLVGRAAGRVTDQAARAPWLAFLVALLWVLHPIQTQSVTYVIQRGESLTGLFYLLTLYCTLRAAEDGVSARTAWVVCAVIACALGMATKAVMVTAPVVAILLDSLIVTGSIGTTLRRRWVLYVALAATWTILVPTGVIGGVLGAGERRTVGFDTTGITALEYASTQPGVLLHYLRLAVWPQPLCLDYMWPVAHGAAVLGPAIAIAALIAGTVWALFTRRAAGFTAAAFFLVLAPTSSIVPIKDLAFEHRMYLPLAAVITLGVFGAHAILVRITRQTGGRLGARIGFAVALVIALALGLTTSVRNLDYHDVETMWRDVAAKRPDNPRAHAKLGRIAEERGDASAAIAHYERALAVDPEYFPAHHSLGALLARTGRMREAVTHLEETIRIEPEYFVAYNSLGNVFAALGRREEAIALYREAIRLEPDLPDPHNNMAIELVRTGRIAEAIAHFVEAIRLRPNYEEAIKNLAIVLDQTDDIDAAIAPYTDRAPLATAHALAHVRAGERAAREGRYNVAIASYRRALAIDPDQPDAPRLLAVAERRRASGS